ncbi:hypothetical protein ANANG_G00256250, partial [Anguilla anguilla]
LHSEKRGGRQKQRCFCSFTKKPPSARTSEGRTQSRTEERRGEQRRRAEERTSFLSGGRMRRGDGISSSDESVGSSA